MNWDGKVVVVTGGGMGIGEATAKLFAEKGAKVVVFDANAEAAKATVAAIEAAGGTALAVTGSVASEADIDALAKASTDAFGRIDGLVNNAGIMTRQTSVAGWTAPDIRRVLEVNLVGPFLASYALAPVMAKTGGGFIVNVSSFGGLVPVAYSPPYSATKAGLLGMTRSMVPTFSEIGVRVNALLPSLTETPLAISSDASKEMAMLKPIDIARGIEHVAAYGDTSGAFFAVSLTDQGPRFNRVADKVQLDTADSSPF